jgi:hypothetical protein
MIFVLVCAAALAIAGCGKNPPAPQPAPPPLRQEQPSAAPEAPRIKQVAVRLGVWDETEKKPADNLEVWMKGMGSWYPGGAGVKTLPSVPVNEEQALFIYPDGRNGKEIEVKFKANDEMISDSVRDMLNIEITDSKVTVYGAPIEGHEVEFKR